jgi:PKD domain/Right handed beta helix region/Concanavalin A-like lectin/glucanases superfamily
MPITVSTAAQLISAMASAKGGETIVLKPGDYGNLALTAGKNFLAQYSSQITITSSDPNNPATFKGLNLQGVSNLKFDHVKFDYKATATDTISTSPFKLTKCANVAITNSEFDGAKATNLGTPYDGFGTGKGLVVTGSTNVAITGNNFHDFHRGAVFEKSSNLTVSANEIRGMSSDGLDFAQVKNVLIQGNSIHDFSRSANSPDHPDMIQFHTLGTTAASANIKIIDNFLNVGSGSWTQSIFMRNEAVDSGTAGASLFYNNVVIANNVIRNSHVNAIYVGETNNLKIDNNTLLQSKTVADGGTVSAPSITVANRSTTVIVTDNVTPRIDPDLASNHAGWLVKNNLIVQRDDASAANFIGKLYSDALDGSNVTIGDLQAVDGSIVNAQHVGSTLKPLLSATQLGGYIVEAEVAGTGHTRHVLDASHVYNALGSIDTRGATATWNFGDGKTGTGLVASHVYGAAGNYTATATITLANGKSLIVDKTFQVDVNHILSVNFEELNAARQVADNTGNHAAATLVTSGNGSAIDLNGGTLKYDANADFFNNSEYTVLVDFKKDLGEELKGGKLVYFNSSYVVTLGADSISVQLGSTAGSKVIRIDHVGIANTDWHHLGLTFSGSEGVAKLFLDGKQIGSVDGLNDAIQVGSSSADLYLGGPFGNGFTGSVDNLHVIGEALSQKLIAAADPMKALNEFHGINDLLQPNGITAFIDSQTPDVAHGIDFTSPTFDASHPTLASLTMIGTTDFLLI